MDAVVPQDVRRGRVRSSRVVLSPRRWGQAAQTIAQRRWLTSPRHLGEYGAAVKPLRRECRNVSALPDYLVCVSTLFAHKAAGAASARHSLHPLYSGGTRIAYRSDANRAAGSKICVCAPVSVTINFRSRLQVLRNEQRTPGHSHSGRRRYFDGDFRTCGAALLDRYAFAPGTDRIGAQAGLGAPYSNPASTRPNPSSSITT